LVGNGVEIQEVMPARREEQHARLLPSAEWASTRGSSVRRAE
jgi:hypothetical protein